MTTSEGNTAVLLSVLWSYATNDEDRMMCHRMVARMKAEGETADKIVETLAGSIVDGLRFGNWPWVVARMSGDLSKWPTREHPKETRKRHVLDADERPPILPRQRKTPRLDSPESPDPFAGNGNS
jgi:hypothetical protein